MAGYFEREASHASVRLTTRNYRGGPPLSVVNGRRIANRQRGDNSSQGNSPACTVNGPSTVTMSNKSRLAHNNDDVGIFDEPLSSSDESDLLAGFESEDEKRESIKERRLKEAAEDIRPTQLRSQSQSESQPESQSFSQVRSSREPKSTDPDLDETFGAFSQQRKRRIDYSSSSKTSNIHGSRINTFSSQSAKNSQTTSYNGSKKRKLDEAKGDSDNNTNTNINTNGFRLPKDREIPSPAKPSKKSEVEDANPPPAFRMPAMYDDTSVERISGIKGFKEPRPEPSTSTVTSSLASKDVFDEVQPISSPISEISLSAFNDDEITLEKNTEEPKATTESLCPNCNCHVDADLVGEFLALPNRRLKDERQFCEQHKLQGAKKEWADKGYPNIDWEAFELRIEQHFPTLDKQLVPQSNSFFRGRLESAMKSGQAKNFRLTLEGDNLENMSCGYYGPKGANRMLTAVTARFSRRLRQLASMDNILKTAGPAAYAQAVLVPELAVLLIKQDMQVDSQEARQILRDSTEIGNRLNAAENDTIGRGDTNDDDVDVETRADADTAGS